MKKIFIILFNAVFLVGGWSGLYDTAVAMEKDGEEWVSTEELRVEAQEKKRRWVEICGDDDWCAMDLYFQDMEKEDNPALNNFMMYQSMMTAINPARGTLKILFNGGDPFMGVSGENAHITEMTLAWREPQMILVEFLEGNEDGLETVGAKLIYRGVGESIKSGEEREIRADSGARLLENSGMVEFMIDTDILGQSYGVYKYGECLEDENYQEGMECRMMFSRETGAVRYFPYGDESMGEDGSGEDDDDDGDTDEVGEAGAEEEMDDSNIGDVESGTEEVGGSENVEEGDFGAAGRSGEENNVVVGAGNDDEERSNSGAVRVIISVLDNNDKRGAIAVARSDSNNDSSDSDNMREEHDDTASDDYVEVPMLAGGCKCENEGWRFPWWIVVMLLMITDALIMWLFWPEKNEKTQKSEKKY